MKTLFVVAAAVLLIVSAGAALAGGYSGRSPVTVSHSRHLDGTDCLMLTDDGSLGWPHSGSATMAGGVFATFQVIDQTFLATFEEQGGSGQSAGWVFSARARNDSIGRGVTDYVYGGEAFDTGAVLFGMRGGC